GREDNINEDYNEGGCKHGNPRNGSNNNNGNKCSYKEILACQPKEFDGNVGTITYTRWVEKMKSMINMSNCAINQRVKYAASSLPEKALTWCNTHAAYTDRFHELAKLVPHLVTPEFKRIDRYIYGLVPEICKIVRATMPSTTQSVILKVGGLTKDAMRNGLLKRSCEKRKENGETSKQEDARSNNKRARIGKGFVAADSGKKEYQGPHPNDMNFNYIIEMANCENEEANKIIRGCTLVLGDVPFSIDLLPSELGSFDVIVVHGERSEENLKHLGSLKADERKLECIPIIRDFPKVFPDDLTGLPPLRPIEFQIELVPEATHIAKAPYRLTPSKMQELSDQIQELQDKGFICLSQSPWGAPVLYVKKKDGWFVDNDWSSNII
nr:hypothetical protein [Tanacetum cinerariifolium]